MNRVYRLIWSEVLNAWVAVSEMSRGRGKGASRKLIAAALMLSVVHAHAGPEGGVVTAGEGSIAKSGATTTINQSSQNLSLGWNTFNVGVKEAVNFVQPSASAIAVNRIADTNASQILGQINANGQVYLINPNGIVFGQSAQVNVGGLVASTLGISDSALGASDKLFNGSGTGSITNAGNIQAAPGGFVAFLGNQVNNAGTIQANGGTAALAAGSEVTLKFADHQLLGFSVSANTLANLAENSGLLQADGGLVMINAGARNSVLAGVVNTTGRLQARTVQNAEGVIKLGGGQVQSLGTLDVSASATGANAGRVSIDGASVLDAGIILASSRFGQGGGVSLSAAGGLIQTAQASVNADGAAQGGNIVLKASNVFTSATLSANGTAVNALGGQIDVPASNQVALADAHLSASGMGASTGGLIRVGGDFNGSNDSVVNAQTTIINGASTLRTDGNTAKGGGKVVVWSDAQTSYFGSIYARGGNVEVSSRNALQFAGDVQTDQLLLDPKNITISSAAGPGAFALVDPNPGSARAFGSNTTVLGTRSSGVFTPGSNVVVAVVSDNASRGAVYLYNTSSGALISTLTGSQANDQVGSSGVAALSNGNYVVGSRFWANGSATNAGAATWGNGTTGVSGAVSSTNSLVGTQTNDRVSRGGVAALSNGNYVVRSGAWANGMVTGACRGPPGESFLMMRLPNQSMRRRQDQRVDSQNGRST